MAITQINPIIMEDMAFFLQVVGYCGYCGEKGTAFC